MKKYISLLVVLSLFISGCSTIGMMKKILSKGQAKMLDNLTPEQAMKASIEMKLLYSSSREKRAFLMAFAKVGFDTFEIAKLMTKEDDKELNVRKFLKKNQYSIMLKGTAPEIWQLEPLGQIVDSIWERLIKNVELNQKLFLEIQ